MKLRNGSERKNHVTKQKKIEQKKKIEQNEIACCFACARLRFDDGSLQLCTVLQFSMNHLMVT